MRKTNAITVAKMRSHSDQAPVKLFSAAGRHGARVRRWVTLQTKDLTPNQLGLKEIGLERDGFRFERVIDVSKESGTPPTESKQAKTNRADFEATAVIREALQWAYRQSYCPGLATEETALSPLNQYAAMVGYSFTTDYQNLFTWTNNAD